MVERRRIDNSQETSEKFFSPGPKVTLLGRVQALGENEEVSSSVVFAGEAARTCYSQALRKPVDYLRSAKQQEVTDSVVESTRESGHLTTRQHVHFVFGLEQVSRAAIWVLHGHPFYNSEQQSQRYVPVKEGNYLIPALSGETLSIYRQSVERQMATYYSLVNILTPLAEKEYFKAFPARMKKAQDYAVEIRNRAQEEARYVLPIATHTLLYHTVSALTLMRYHRTCQFYDVPTETKMIVGKMVDEVAKVDPRFKEELSDPIPLDQTPEFVALTDLRGEVNFKVAKEFVSEFDAELAGNTSQLVDFSARGHKTLADGVRSVLGLSKLKLPDRVAIALVMDPSKNRILSEVLNLTTLSKISRVMELVSYTFAKKISHTADSQDQRHRTIPAARPVLAAHYTGQPDYITSRLIRESPEAHKLYRQIMVEVFASINQLLDRDVSWEKASYLLPNAFPIRFYESGSLLNLHHKMRMRLCYNSQEEIWQASLEEADQIEQVHRGVGEWLLPPCGIRQTARQRPYCPEGKRFCGIPVWEFPKGNIRS